MSAAAILTKAAEVAAERRAQNLHQYAVLWLQPAEIAWLEEMRKGAGDASRTAFIRSLIREIIADDRAAEGK